MAVALSWAECRSKDPATKVGAAIYDLDTGGLYLGYNGFPSSVPDAADIWARREEEVGKLCKYDVVVHAEVNAVRKAMMAGVDLTRATLFCTHLPCPKCMRDVVLVSGIKNVFYVNGRYKSLTPRGEWVVHQLAQLAGVNLEQMVELADLHH